MARLIDYGSDHCTGLMSNHFNTYDRAHEETWSDYIYARVKTTHGGEPEKVYWADFGFAGCNIPDEILEIAKQQGTRFNVYRRHK